MEDIGLITQPEVEVLDNECRDFHKKGLLNFRYGENRPAYNQANLFAQYLEERRQFRKNRAGSIFQKT